uniref:Uncharacterized protein n=1 Tax=Rhizobium meliloti TaxID=382 RepID=I2E1Z6_RHIML|nr:short hypothetical protein [Sinorhizobium meliloti]
MLVVLRKRQLVPDVLTMRQRWAVEHGHMAEGVAFSSDLAIASDLHSELWTA